ncbi:helix-turn-helix domain-containing protein [Pimelobacter simplex]|uniref:helix-turn-helix domain-containing protein n=1 Tax=Nocardioides simplex TaxID=2045 RepID=UPI00214FDFBE|nr:helix-turn-helix domain-containing protein [Pimelobacter simplex]UUW88417.1 helix-turn-helix domain-containing protein [Pimelobacter simplex]UUW97921.1 helix-turn-helix domain-containing protein [Pimelobacter simplex]
MDFDYLTPRQAAEAVPLGTADWYREQLTRGRLLGYRVNGRWYTTRDDIEDMVRAAVNRPARARPRRRRAAGLGPGEGLT